VKRPPAVQEHEDSWVGVDLDRTLAHYESGQALEVIGEAKPQMVALVKRLLEKGIRVKILTARVDPSYPELEVQQEALIQKWLYENGLPWLEITAIKDFKMWFLIDDRAYRVLPNEGQFCGGCSDAVVDMLGMQLPGGVRDRRPDKSVL
jgi:hypothetical protein